jgi:hypothetical protein
MELRRARPYGRRFGDPRRPTRSRMGSLPGGARAVAPSEIFETCPVGIVNLCKIWDGLNADELEQCLREHGAELSPCSAPAHASGPRWLPII